MFEVISLTTQLKYVRMPDNVAVDHFERVLLGIADSGIGSQMNHSQERTLSAKYFLKSFVIADIGFLKFKIIKFMEL